MEYVGRTLSKWARHDEMHSHIAGAEAKDLYPEHDNWACACPPHSAQRPPHSAFAVLE